MIFREVIKRNTLLFVKERRKKHIIDTRYAAKIIGRDERKTRVKNTLQMETHEQKI